MNSKTSSHSPFSLRFLIFGILTLFILTGAYVIRWSSQNSNRLTEHSQRFKNIAKLMQSAVPDVDTRNSVKYIRIEDIKSVRLSGDHTGYARNSDLDVSDPKICALFLNALKQAVFRGGISGSRTSRFQLVLKAKPGLKSQVISSDYTTLSGGFPLECFGLPFAHALDALGDYQAGQLRLLITKKRDLIDSAEILKTSYTKNQFINNPAELQRLLDELAHADDSIYAYTSPGLVVHAILYERGGGKIPLHCLVCDRPPDEPDAQANVPFAFRRTYDTFIDTYNNSNK